MTADDAIVTCTCGKPHRYDTDPHEWKPSAVVSSGPDWDEAVEAAMIAVHGGPWAGGDSDHQRRERDKFLRALAAAAPALTRQAVAAERERIATAMLADAGTSPQAYYYAERFAAIARAEPGTNERPHHE